MEGVERFEDFRGHVEWVECEECVFVYNLYVNEEHRGNGYPLILFKILKRRYGKPIQLMCRPSLYSYYKKLGFRLTYFEMEY